MKTVEMNGHWLKYLFLLLILPVCLQLQAQDEDFPDEDEDVTLFKKERKFKPERLRIGFFPEFAISSDFSGNTTLFIGINPSISYLVHDRFEPGVGMIYSYLNVLGVPGGKIHQVGFFQDAKVHIWNGIFLYERGMFISENNLVARLDNQGQWFYETNGRRSTGNVFLGGGYDFPIGDRSAFSVFIMINMLTNANFPNRRPYYGMRFAFGLGKR